MRLRRLLARLLLAAALGLPAATVARAEALNIEAARIHFEAGKSYYEESRYEDALKEFREAYRLSRKPALLYNIGRCQEKLMRYREAQSSMREYLELDPAAEDRETVRQQIAALELLAAEGREAKPAPAAPRRLFTWIVGGAGVALLGASLGTYLGARADWNDLDAACGPGHAACPRSLAGKLDQGRGLYDASIALFATGSAALAASVALYFLEGRAPSRKGGVPTATVEPALFSGGGGLRATLRF